MLSLILSLSLLNSLLEFAPTISENDVARFCQNTIQATNVVPYVQLDVHIPATEDFQIKKELLVNYVENVDMYTCKLTDRMDDDTRSCLGFLRIAVLDHGTVDLAEKFGHLSQKNIKTGMLARFPFIQMLNEYAVHEYLRARLNAVEALFNTTLEEDKKALRDTMYPEEAQNLQRQITARKMIQYWLRMGEVVAEIYTAFEVFPPSLNDDFEGQENFHNYLMKHIAQFLNEKDSPVFLKLFHAYFEGDEDCKKAGGQDNAFSGMVQLEMAFLKTVPELVEQVRAELKENEEGEEEQDAQPTRTEFSSTNKAQPAEPETEEGTGAEVSYFQEKSSDRKRSKLASVLKRSGEQGAPLDKHSKLIRVLKRSGTEPEQEDDVFLPRRDKRSKLTNMLKRSGKEPEQEDVVVLPRRDRPSKLTNILQVSGMKLKSMLIRGGIL